MTTASTPERPPRHPPDSPPTAANPPKTVLFCPCGRDAPVTEWRTERDGDDRRLLCPDCGDTLTVR